MHIVSGPVEEVWFLQELWVVWGCSFLIVLFIYLRVFQGRQLVHSYFFLFYEHLITFFMLTLLPPQPIFQLLVQYHPDLLPLDALFQLPDPTLHMGLFCLKASSPLNSCVKVVGFSDYLPKRNLRSITQKPSSLELCRVQTHCRQP